MERKKQADRILHLLQNPYDSDGWVTLWEIMELHIASHTKRISELRDQGHVIEKKEEKVGRQRRTKYRLLGSLQDQPHALAGEGVGI